MIDNINRHLKKKVVFNIGSFCNLPADCGLIFL